MACLCFFLHLKHHTHHAISVLRAAWNRSGCVHAYNPDATHVCSFRRALKTVLGLPAFTNTPPVFARAADLKLIVLFHVCCPGSYYRAGRL
eukprot:7309950-Ditylum_brightwellii.AAC.1